MNAALVRESTAIEEGIRLVKEKGIELVIGAGGANIMDCAKLIAFGTYHTNDLWAFGAEMRAYTGLVTLVQLSASTIGDKNPEDSNARGVILYGASISTSGRLGLGKEENYAYDIYELEFIQEVLFGAAYRKSLTTLFPRFLKAMAKYHKKDIRRYFKDAFGYEESVEESADKLTGLFADLGVDMYFDGEVSTEAVKGIDISTILSADEVTGIVKECLR